MDKLANYIFLICFASSVYAGEPSPKEAGTEAYTEIVSLLNTKTPYDLDAIRTYELPKPLGEYVHKITVTDGQFTVELRGAICAESWHKLTKVCSPGCEWHINPEFRCKEY